MDWLPIDWISERLTFNYTSLLISQQPDSIKTKFLYQACWNNRANNQKIKLITEKSRVKEKVTLIIIIHTHKRGENWFGRNLPSGSKKKICLTFPFGRVFSKVWIPFSCRKFKISLDIRYICKRQAQTFYKLWENISRELFLHTIQIYSWNFNIL